MPRKTLPFIRNSILQSLENYAKPINEVATDCGICWRVAEKNILYLSALGRINKRVIKIGNEEKTLWETRR